MATTRSFVLLMVSVFALACATAPAPKPVPVAAAVVTNAPHQTLDIENDLRDAYTQIVAR